MAKQPTIPPTNEHDVRYQTVVFLNAVIPVLKPIIASRSALQKAFAGKSGIVQISALAADGESVDGRPPRLATHLVVDDGQVSVKLGAHPAPNVELQFGSREKLNAFFTGSLVLPAIRGGLANPGLLKATVQSLLAMSRVLGQTQPPSDVEEQKLLVRCMFYLLTTGISQLNKAGHPRVCQWSANQPDRVYALSVIGHEELDAHLRVKAGKTKAFRGSYTRSKPFFTMAFDSPRSALGILLDVDDMIESTTSQKIIMQGAPEYGAELGELMQLVGSYAK